MQRSPRVQGAIIGLKGGLIWGAIAVLISLKYHFFIYAYLVMGLTSVIGALYGSRYLQKATKNNKWLKLLFWSNTFTWILPPIGFFTYGATHSINLRNHDEDRQLFMRLSTACFWLSFINAIIIAKYLT
jgi:multisubunit Na+/H+ antiporter MnhF subunit